MLKKTHDMIIDGYKSELAAKEISLERNRRWLKIAEERLSKIEKLEKERARREKNGRFKSKAKKKGLLI